MKARPPGSAFTAFVQPGQWGRRARADGILLRWPPPHRGVSQPSRASAVWLWGLGPSFLYSCGTGTGPPPRGPDPTWSRRAESTQPGSTRPFVAGSPPAALRPGAPRASCPRIALCAAPWPEVALCAPSGSRRRWRLTLRGSSPEALFFSFPPNPLSSRLRPQPCLPQANGDLGDAGSQGGDEARCSPPPPTWALSHRNVGGGSSFRRPRHRIVGGSAWQPPGECPRRAPKAGPPLTRDSLPLLLWRGGGRGPGSQPWKEARGRGAGAGLLLPFLASSSGRCPLLPLGPERGEASRRRRRFRGGLLHSPSGAAGLQLELEGGQLEGGARRALVAVLGAGRGACMDLTACVSACVCSLRRRPGPTRPVRPPRASEVRVPGRESGGGEREGQGRGSATAL